jgi:hypothetical protein
MVASLVEGLELELALPVEEAPLLLPVEEVPLLEVTAAAGRAED